MGQVSDSRTEIRLKNWTAGQCYGKVAATSPLQRVGHKSGVAVNQIVRYSEQYKNKIVSS